MQVRGNDRSEEGSNSPLVSVIVPVYNGELDLPELIECLRSQTYPSDCAEYLLVDNQSRDRTPDLLQSAATLDRKITICPLSEPNIQSSYAARNVGIRHSTGEILAFTDADCRPAPTWLEELLKPFVDRKVGISVGEILPLPGHTLWEQYATLQNTLSQRHTLAHPYCPYGQTANLAIRRQIFQEVGLFRPYLTTGGDADLCWRILRETSSQLSFAESAIVRHRHRSTWKQLQKQWHRYGESNRYLHELHGVDLMREPTGGEAIYRLVRWLLKELPPALMKGAIGQANLAELLNTPIDLLCAEMRATGQRESKLPEKAREIERLEP